MGGRPKQLKDVGSFWNVWVHEFYCLKAMRTLKISTQISNCELRPLKNSDPPGVSKTQTPQNAVPPGVSKTQTPEKLSPSGYIENWKPPDWMKQWMLILLFVFIIFDTSVGRFDIANLIAAVGVQAIASVGFHCTLSCISGGSRNISVAEGAELKESKYSHTLTKVQIV